MSKRHAIELVLSPDHLHRIYGTLQDIIDGFPTEISRRNVSEFAADRRVLPSNTPYPGRWRNDLTPFMVEPMDCFSARSGVQEGIMLKCSQIGATASMENIIGYIVSEAPGPTLFVSSKEDLLRKWVNKRFNPLIKSCDLEDKIFKQNVLKGGRASGNQMFSKEFPGGSLDIVSAQSELNLRSDTIRYLIMDEVGSWPWSVSGLGDPIAIARARTANWGTRRRIFAASTPGVEGECRMLPLYREGDQRRYFLPCPQCQGRFVLRFQCEPNDFYEGIPAAALQYDLSGGMLDSQTVRVTCPHCNSRISEAQRYPLIQDGVWTPTAEPVRRGVQSYQIGRLYSLMDDWTRLAQLEIDSQADPLVLQTFMNHAAGWPYRETTQKPDINKVYELRGGYNSGEIPTDKVLFLTGAIDVQRGNKDNPDKPARLELEILGHGIGYRTWSLQYKVFRGAVNDPYQGAWKDLFDYVAEGGMKCRRSDGLTLQPHIVFVDSGDGETETVVFDFCARLNGFIPIKGVSDLKRSAEGQRADTILDERGPRDRDRFRVNSKYDQTFVSVLSVWFKNIVWRSLKIPRQPGDEQRPRFMDHPRDYPDNYFQMLIAEERREDGSFWRPSSRSNESLSLKIYNLCAGEYFLYLAVQAERKAMLKAPGWDRTMAERIQSRHILDRLTLKMKRKQIGG